MKNVKLIIKNLVIFPVLTFCISSVVQAEATVPQSLQPIAETSYHKSDPNKDILDYPYIFEGPEIAKPKIKFYSNKDFKGKPTAIVKEEGFFVHSKKVCVWNDPERTPGIYLYPMANVNIKCLSYGPVFSWTDEKWRSYFQIELDTVTPNYYEVISNNEKFYINPKELVGFNFKESEKSLNLKMKKTFESMMKMDPSIEKFIKEVRQCITKQDMKCLFADEDRSKRTVREWLNQVCKTKPLGTGSLCIDLMYKKEEPKFEGKIKEAFWNGAATCFPEDLKELKFKRAQDGVITFKMGAAYMGSCTISTDEKNHWKVYLIELPYGDEI